ncbi:MAG: PEP-CTERM sorting domain-containing protein [Sedimentisphaerales bacterium]|nr:PEP-CTERM sorting domain-containing protein [Sedimentisphaerales bacterium]
MKLRSLIVVLVLAFAANSAFAVYYWDTDSARAPLIGSWSDVSNWVASNSTEPGPAGNIPQLQPADGDQEIQVYGAAGLPKPIVYVDDDQTFTCWYSNRVRFFGGATVNIIPGGTLQGIGWLRVGEGSQANEGTTSAVIQTGGLMAFENGVRDDYKDPAGLTISDGGSGSDCEGLYHISGGTMTYLHPEATAGGHLRIGDRGGVGTMRVTGTAPVVHMGALEMGGRAGKTDLSRVADGTLVFEMTADGVSPIIVDDYVDVHTYEPSSTHLVVWLTEALDDPWGDIVLVDNRGTDPVHGQFDTFNDGFAYEGVRVYLSNGTWRMLTYRYNADTMSLGGNDIALYTPEPATLALLGLGAFIIKRKR